MVVIRGVTGGTNVPGARSARGASGGFRVGGGAEGGREAGAASAASGANAIGLLAVQELAPAGERDARAFRRGEDMLRELKALQLELLEGRTDPVRLQELVRLAEGEKPSDPGLAEAMEAIVLRARLELARRGIES